VRERGVTGVMQLVLSLVPGGTERLTVELATRLAPRFRMVVCCLNEPGDWAHEVTDRGIPVVTLGRLPGFHPSLGRRIAAVAREHSVKVVHCHHFSPFVYGWIAGLVDRRLRILYTEHGRLSDAPAKLKRRIAHAALSRLSGHSYAVSHDLRRYLVDSGFAPRKMSVIHNGIDLGPLPDDAARREARAAFGLPADAFVVGTVARLDPVKDLAVAIRAIAEVRRTLPQALLAIAGDGPERAHLDAVVAEAGAADAVRWIGYTPAARRLLAGCDLYVNTSVSEGISLTILEAMAAGLPVVATRVGGTPEVVEAGGTGLLVPARSAAALAEAIVQLGHDPERRRAMGHAGRARVEHAFSIDRMVEDYAREYVRLGARAI
jgi:glycosyltransferase involved in cell wall biosynthesis